VLEAVQQDVSTMRLADNQLFSNRQFVLAASAVDAAAAMPLRAPELLEDASFRADAQRANSLVVHYFINTESLPSLAIDQPPQHIKPAAHPAVGLADPTKQQQLLKNTGNWSHRFPLTSSCSNAGASPSQGGDDRSGITQLTSR